MTGPDGVVLAVVMVLLAYYLIRCRTLSRRAGSELPDLLQEFKADIVTRADRGHDPDWLRYVEESDRRHEYTCESLRNYATMALATGIGGTMALVLIHLRTVGSAPESTDAIPTLLENVGLALIASVLGVATNLIILMFILPHANKLFDFGRENYLTGLRGISENHPPRTPDARLNDTINEKLEEYLESTAENFPRVIAGFRDSVASLGDVATTFNASSGKIETATAVLLSSITELNTLPASLGNELTKARQEWTNDVRENQERYLRDFRQVLAEQGEAVRKTLSALEESEAKRGEAQERWREHQLEEQNNRRQDVRQLVNATSDIVNAVGQLPQGFREEIVRASDSLGRVFGSEARNQVTDLITATRRGNEKLSKDLEGHINQLLNEMGDMVQQGLKPTLEGISRIGANLETAGRELRKSITEFADHGESFRISLHGAARQIEDSSAQLVTVHEETRASISKIQERYYNMHKVLSESIKEIESLLDELFKEFKRSPKRRFLNWIRAFVKRDRG